VLKRFALSLILIPALATFALAAEPNAATIVKKMKAALEPQRPSVRLMTLKISAAGSDVAHWTMAQARGRYNGHNWILNVVLRPPDARGIALLSRENTNGTGLVEFSFLPAVNRVREIATVPGYEPFLGTDFSYEDLGFVRLGKHPELLGTTEKAGKKVYEIKETFVRSPWYGQVITYVSQSTDLPVRRDFYTPNRVLFKSEYFEDVKTIDGVPTVTRFVMKMPNSGNSSEIDVSKVTYGHMAPADLFDPRNLPTILKHPFWKSLH
jgi:hypothetical protein